MLRRLLPVLVGSLIVHAGVLALLDDRAPRVRQPDELVELEVVRGRAEQTGGPGVPAAPHEPARPAVAAAPVPPEPAVVEQPPEDEVEPTPTEPVPAVDAPAVPVVAAPAAPVADGGVQVVAARDSGARTSAGGASSTGPGEGRGDVRSGGGADARAGGGHGDARAEILRRLRASVARCYPEAALRRRIEGTTTVGFCVAPDGRPSDIHVADRSSSGLLDRAAVECVIPQAAPLPAIEGCLEVPIRFSVR